MDQINARKIEHIKKSKQYFRTNENISENNQSWDITYKPSLTNTSKYYKDVILSDQYRLLFPPARLSYKP